ncbi:MULTISPECIES: hypothetical protein [unclassified Moorena]|uniref:hypothetical protein n=1 Tax=unclassified Moorena TaxID=2683338 RepID=UPI0013FF4359|nr:MULTISPECIES: hypothetical protein [unclassified Moorena]NEO17200.1 hypothetical protein [Moorena sp. SIO3E8]NEQ03744.1 hypothetical protein [Moorena sp. SIO3F7]
MQNKPQVGGDRKKPFLLNSPPNNLGLLTTRARSTLAKGHATRTTFNLQPWPKATLREQPPNLLTLAKGHATRTTS